MRFGSLASQAGLLLASVACSRAACLNGPTVITAETPLSCDNQAEAECDVLACEYVSCSIGGSRRLSDANSPQAVAPGVGVVDPEECIPGCRRRPGTTPRSCSEFADFDCPIYAGCMVSQGEPAATAPAAPVQVSVSPAVAPLAEAPLNEQALVSPQMVSPAIGPASVPAADGESSPPAQVYCEWVEGFGCMGTVAGQVGDTYLNGRITLEMCLSDTDSAEQTGCQTPDILAWCENHTFLDVQGKTVCAPTNSTFENYEVYSEAVRGYESCPTQVGPPCKVFREFLFTSFDCPGCAATAELAALSEVTCAAQVSKDACLAVSADRFPGGAAPAPAPAVARPSDQVATCAWVSHMGCIATVNDGPEGIKLLEHRVELEACIGYNSQGLSGCPDTAPDFCMTRGFPDLNIEVCMPAMSSYDSGRDFIHHFVIYKECHGLTGDDCSIARDYLYAGMNCTECGAWADFSALNEANCTRILTKEVCVGRDERGHVYQETLGDPTSGGIIPAEAAVEADEAVPDDGYLGELGDEAEAGDGDDGDATAVTPLVDAPGTCMWIEECCCYPTVEGQFGAEYVGARVKLEFCLFDTTDALDGCKSPQYSETCSEFAFSDINNGGATLCLPATSTFKSGAELIDALSIYYTCHGLSDLDCNLARGYLFENMGCASCFEAARIAAPLEGSCKLASSLPQCLDAGSAASESDREIINEVEAGVELGKLAPLASANKDSSPPPALEGLLRPREVIQPSFTVSNPAAQSAEAVPVASAAPRGVRRSMVATAVAAVLVAAAAV